MWQSWRGSRRSNVPPSRQDPHQLSLLTVAAEDEARAVAALAPASGLFVAGTFWLEKLLIVLDFFQIMGLLWITAQPWPWPPYPFVLTSRFTVYSNLDVFSAAKTGALLGASGNIGISKWGMLKGGYVAYAMGFLFAQTVLILAYLALCRFVFPTWARRWNRFQPPILAALLFVLYIFYLPVGIAVFRLYYCEQSSGPTSSLSTFPAGTAFLSADPTLQCWVGPHLACVVLAVLFHGPVFVGLPFVVYVFVRDAVVYADARDHEKRLQAWELAYLLEIDRHWLAGNVWLCGSFTRPASRLYFHQIVLKATLLLFSFFLRDDFKSQAAAMWWAFIALFLYYGIWCLRCYRADSSSIMHKIALLLLLANFSFAAVESSGIRNAVTVASSQALFLLVANAAGLALLVGVIVAAALNPLTTHPVVRTLFRVTHSELLSPLAAQWVADLRLAQRQRSQLAAVPVEAIDPRVIDGCLVALRLDWLAARSYGSIFQLLLQDAIEDGLVLRALYAPKLYREDADWDKAYQQATAQLSFGRRRSQMALVSPLKRRLLSKLLALRLFQKLFNYESGGGPQARVVVDEGRGEAEVDRLLANPVALDEIESSETFL